MLERVSALGPATPYAGERLRIEEALEFSLIQFAPAGLKLKPGVAAERDGRTLFLVSPKQAWSAGPRSGSQPQGLALSSSRTRILLEGAAAREVLAKGIAIDFDPKAFIPGHFASTGLHHTPVMVHCLAESTFHLYALRTFAASVWDWLLDSSSLPFA
jgi:methylglutamate dehydrogenase subunit D